MEKRGQAAMEFLMTYGWAILAAIIAIGVLAWFGVFSPGRYVSNACTINAPFGCDEFGIDATGITVAIRNGYGDAIDVASIEITGDCGVTEDNAGAGWVGVSDGDIIGGTSVAVTCALTSGSNFKGDLIVTYTKEGGTIAQTATGTIKGRVP